MKRKTLTLAVAVLTFGMVAGILAQQPPPAGAPPAAPQNNALAFIPLK